MFRPIAALMAALFAIATPEAEAVDIEDPENTLIIELAEGRVVVEMLPEVAPDHVARIKKLARDGAYDNVAFHRVIDGFMAQTGDVAYGDMEAGFDPRRVGTGGSDLPDLEAEFSDMRFERGTVGMARSRDPNSANSQFFIMFDAAPHLHGQYTVWGRVIDGMEHVDALKRGAGRSGAVENPDRMRRVYVAADE